MKKLLVIFLLMIGTSAHAYSYDQDKIDRQNREYQQHEEQRLLEDRIQTMENNKREQDSLDQLKREKERQDQMYENNKAFSAPSY